MPKKAFLILQASPGNSLFKNIGGTFAASVKGAFNNVQNRIDRGQLKPGYYHVIPTQHLHVNKLDKTKPTPRKKKK